MFFPERSTGLPPAAQATYMSKNDLAFPYSHDGRPVIISPTDYGLNYKPSRTQRLKLLCRRIWFSIRRWIRQDLIWLHELGAIYQDGFYRSTIPSADVLASPRREPIRKLLWCAALAPLIYFTISDLKDVIEGYMVYPVVYTYEYKTNDTLSFPDVTICNVNPLLRSKACRNDSILWVQKIIKVDNEEYKITPFCNDKRADMCKRLCDENEAPLEPNKEDTRIRFFLANWIKETIAVGEPASIEIGKLGHQVEDTVEKCSYASNDDCTRNFDRFTKTVRQLYGSCFCFHCESRKNLTDNRNISETERITMEEKDSEREKYYEYGTLSSPLSGLVIQLNTEINEYLPTSHEVGFVAMIHEHNTDTFVCQDAIYILPGYTTYVGLNLATTFNLEPPYEDGCRKEWPWHLRVGHLDGNVKVIEPAVEMSQYRRAMCLEYCEIEYLIYKCKCIKNYSGVKVHPDLVEDYKYCKTPRKSKCAKDTLEGKNNLFWQARCDCRRECETQRYATDVSVAGFIAEDATRNISGENHIEELMAEMSTARLVVYFHSFTYEHVKAIKKYDGIRVLSNIGGINGMYLGLSFYLLFQALDILVMGAIQFVRNIRQQRFKFDRRGNLMTSVGVQTSGRLDRRKREAVQPSYADVALIPARAPVIESCDPLRKNIWDVFQKPSSNEAFNTTEQFTTSHGRFEIQYNKKRS